MSSKTSSKESAQFYPQSMSSETASHASAPMRKSRGLSLGEGDLRGALGERPGERRVEMAVGPSPGNPSVLSQIEAVQVASVITI